MLDFDKTKPVSLNGTVLATFERGEGNALVFVHGSASDLRTWTDQLDFFPDRYRTIAYSRRYHAPNAPIASDAGDPIQTHVDDLVGLIRVMGAEQAHVVGHSWGGLVSLLAAKQAPELFRSLVLIEPPVISMHVNVPPKLVQLIGLLFSAPRLALAIVKFGASAAGPSEKAFRRGDDKLAVERFGRGVLGDRYFGALSGERYSQVWENRGPDRALALHQGFPDLIGTSFTDVRVPVLLIGRGESPRLFGLLIEDLEERLPDASIKVIGNASHLVHENASEALNAAIQEFLGNVG
ncbi:alpha/beta fold hydrolase [Limimaricola litoreus]|uniref:Alpha/beta hydrolase n=1 Tax=Limimaricola litoreus TaxID=2955316 RepID=A0A9X2FV33_9RHOB|nr:alpha/beta hydrolase [Limimaricola litoreus]MCP1167688.1 alpha/beta hydrolase [Limimaricola litoreus]